MLKTLALVFGMIVVYCSLYHSIEANMTMAQLRNSQKLVRKLCQPKNNVSTELIEGMKSGQFPEDRNLMCYVRCVMAFAQTTNLEEALKNIDMMLPEEIKEATKEQAIACKDTRLGYTDKCEAAFYTLKCMTEFNPDNYIFP